MTNENLEATRRRVALKLHPETIHTTTFVRSLLAYLLEEEWTEPHIVDLRCDRKGMLTAWESDSNGYLRLLCGRDDLIRGLLILADLVPLTPGERSYLLSRVPSTLKKQRQS